MKKLIKPMKYISVAALAICMTYTGTFALNYGSVNASSLNLRQSASTSSSVLASLPKGTCLAVLEKGSEWFKVATAGKIGYVSADYVKNYNCTINFNIGTGVVTANSLNIRNSATTSASIVGSVSKGSTLKLVGVSANGWYRVQSGSVTGYACASYITVAASSSQTSRGSTSSSSGTSTTVQSSVSSSSVIATAKAQLGKPYSYGSAGPSAFDCSGLVYYCYRQNGKTLARSSASQYSTTARVSKGNLQPGDLVFFSNENSNGRVSHVGIYVGGGQYIHASTASYKITYGSLGSSWASRYYVGAGRV